MTWWEWLLVGMAISYVPGVVLVAALVFVGRESHERRRGGFIDMTGTRPSNGGAKR